MEQPVSAEIKKSNEGNTKETAEKNVKEGKQKVEIHKDSSLDQSKDANEACQVIQTKEREIVQDLHDRVLDLEEEPSRANESEEIQDVSLDTDQEMGKENLTDVPLEQNSENHIAQQPEPHVTKGSMPIELPVEEPQDTEGNMSVELPVSSQENTVDESQNEDNKGNLTEESADISVSPEQEENFQQSDVSMDIQEPPPQETNDSSEMNKLPVVELPDETNNVISPKDLPEKVIEEDVKIQQPNMQLGEAINEKNDEVEKSSETEILEAVSQEDNSQNAGNKEVACDISQDFEEKQEESKVTEEERDKENIDLAVEGEVDVLTDMIGHMALVESPAVEPNKENAPSVQDLDSSATAEVKEVEFKKESAMDVNHSTPAAPIEPINDQPGDSHPEPYRLTKDNQSTQQEINEAIATAAKAEQDMTRSSRISNPGDMIHHIKQVSFKDKNVGIVTQNENGPCPLVAIINTMLLRWEIQLPATEIVSAAKLMEYIGDAMLESVPKNLSGEAERLNYEQNMHDAMAVLPKLQTGLDVNVKFTGVRDFEYTPECIIFDLLRIPLYHGWLIDPQPEEVAKAVGQAGYNQLVEKVITQKCSANEDQVTEALIIENFLESTASQLTYHGLAELNAAMNEGEIGVLFRNNHFSTIYKHQKELLQLVTDQGFLAEPNVVWETLSSIDGDGQFVDSHFRTVPPKPEPTTTAVASSSPSPNTSGHMTAEQQIDHDFLVALSLQDEQQPAAALPDEAAPLSEDEKSTQEKADEELARQLQREEERQAAAEQQQQQPQQQQQQPQEPTSARSPQQKKKDNCNIL